LIALGALSGAQEGWEVLERSFPEQVFLPTATEAYDDAFELFQKLQQSSRDSGGS
jgi:hypothetical protein